MKRPTFLHGVAVAAIASITAGVLFSALTPLFASDATLRLLIATLSVTYIVFLLRRSRERIGRITTLGAWSIVAGATWFYDPPLIMYLAVHVGFVWLIRSLYFYSSVLSAIADLGLSAFSLAAAVWAATQTGSVFASIWCFFLVQALFVVIPVQTGRKTQDGTPGTTYEDRFEYAHRAAEGAVRKLSSLN